VKTNLHQLHRFASDAAGGLPLASTPVAAPARHVSVLAKETLEALAPQSDEIFVDGTLGAGGHSKELATAGAQVIGMDRDLDALAIAGERLASFGKQVRLIQANFRDVEEVLDQLGIREIDGALLDLGISSMQVDEAERGFSFLRDGPLDMRMNATGGEQTAADLVNSLPEARLEVIFREYGEEPHSRKAARMLCDRRENAPFTTTGDLAGFLEKALGRTSGKHPATRCFQALRIAVNDELGAVREALPAFVRRLKIGGRLALITFHSLEDRMVKQFFKTHSTPTLDRPEWPAPRKNPEFCLERITPGAVQATDAETTINPRARSAKLRAVRKIQRCEAAKP